MTATSIANTTQRMNVQVLAWTAAALLLSTQQPWCRAAGFDWPQWQGADRNAMSKETGLLKKW
ncbi:MAG TPA: hypothetical protein VNO52_08495, partial [Methylomirabilota bacterium]|nr:hypothetical protein [Methylomirabilota bacterium]